MVAALATKERETVMRAKTHVKAGSSFGARSQNQNQTLVCEARKGLRVKTNLKAGMKLAADRWSV